jgi:hypothetical protein
MTTLVDAPQTKRCSQCGETKPATREYFYGNTFTRDGLQGMCKGCRGLLKKERKLNPRPKKSEGQKRCARCNEVKPFEAFSREKKRGDGFYPRCKACVKAWQTGNSEVLHAYFRRYQREYSRSAKTAAQAKAAKRRWNQNNKGYNKEYRRTHTAELRVSSQRRRTRKLALPNTWTVQQWLKCLEYWRYRCAACESQLRDLFGNVEPHADHWYPLSKGGPTTVDNMICLCSPCNLSKHDKHPEVWLVERFGKRKAAEILKRVTTYFEWAKAQQ